MQVSLERWSSDVTSADSAKRHRDRHLGRPALRGRQGVDPIQCPGAARRHLPRYRHADQLARRHPTWVTADSDALGAAYEAE